MTDRRPMESQTYHQTIVPQTLNSMLKQPARATHTPFGLDRYAAPPTPGLILESKSKSRFSDKRLRGIEDPNITRSSCNCEPEDGVQNLVLKNRDQPLGNGGRRTIDTIVDQLWICNCLQNWIHISHNRCPGNLLRCTVRTHSGVSSPAQ